MEIVLIAYLFYMFLLSLHLIDVKLDDRHSISLLQLIILQAIGAKGIYYKDWLSFTPCFLNWSRGFFIHLKSRLNIFLTFLVRPIDSLYRGGRLCTNYLIPVGSLP